MSRQHWARGVWGIAVAVASSALAIAGAQQNNPPQNANQNPSNAPQQNNLQPGNQQQGNPQQAQQQAPMRTFQRNPDPRGMAMYNDVDHYLIKVLVKANKDEIEMGKLAQQRSSNPEVKQLANQMVQDHTRFLSRLESLKHNGQPAANPQVGHQPMQRGVGFRGIVPEGADQQQPQAQQQPGPAADSTADAAGTAAAAATRANSATDPATAGDGRQEQFGPERHGRQPG